MLRVRAGTIVLVLVMTSCGGSGGEGDSSTDGVEEEAQDEEPWDPPPAAEDWSRDILSTALVVDLSSLAGTAEIVLAPSGATAASFEAGGLTILDVRCEAGPLEFEIVGGRLDVGVPADAPPIMVDYTFALGAGFDGLMESGATFIWPYFCGNLFPCHSEPADGLTFTLDLENVPDGATAVFPGAIDSAAPSYQIAWAAGDYTYASLGTTGAGTEIGVWYLPGGETAAHIGTVNLAAAFDWYESTLGPYPFGDRAGAVAVDWGPGAYGGMEHHPYWHVGTSSMSGSIVHIHEAAHGWFGGGVRIRCWEDFVLSEGTVTYLAARATGQVAGPGAEAAVWSEYETRLDRIVSSADGIAWPDSCGEVDIIEDGLFSEVPYIKGAYFYRAVAGEIGVDTLDSVLALFFETYVGQAAGMQDMIDLVLAETGFDGTALADGWLRSLGRPDA